MIRLFVALRPPPAVRDTLADLMEGVPVARWPRGTAAPAAGSR